MKTKVRQSHRIAAFAVAALAGATSIGLLAPSASARDGHQRQQRFVDANSARAPGPHGCAEAVPQGPRCHAADEARRRSDADGADGCRACEAQGSVRGVQHPDATAPTGRPRPPDADGCAEAVPRRHGVTKPAKPADGQERAKPTAEQRAKFEAAAKKCNIELPAHRDNDNNQSGASTDNTDNSTTTTQGSSTNT